MSQCEARWWTTLKTPACELCLCEHVSSLLSSAFSSKKSVSTLNKAASMALDSKRPILHSVWSWCAGGKGSIAVLHPSQESFLPHLQDSTSTCDQSAHGLEVWKWRQNEGVARHIYCFVPGAMKSKPAKTPAKRKRKQSAYTRFSAAGRWAHISRFTHTVSFWFFWV